MNETYQMKEQYNKTLMNENENMVYQNLWEITAAVLRDIYNCKCIN